MPVIPERLTFDASIEQVLNAIRNEASADYRQWVPAASPNAANIREIGSVVVGTHFELRNEFLTALMNKIALTIITSKSFENPLAVFKKGDLQMGETIEEIFVGLVQAQSFDPVRAESEWMKRSMPDVKTAYHYVNYKKLYKVTVSDAQLQAAFMTTQAMKKLIDTIIASLLNSAEYDEWLVAKYLVARSILDGRLHAEQIPTVETGNMKEIVGTMLGVSNSMEFMNSDYNRIGVENFTKKDNQYFILNAKFAAKMDVDTLASAYNLDKVSFKAHMLTVDSFGNFGKSGRLDDLMADSPNYQAFTEDELAALDAVPGVLVSSDWLMLYDNQRSMESGRNPQGLYENWYYHVWKLFGVSPFSDAVVFVPGLPEIRSVSVSPSTATVAKGTTVLFSANVATDNFASKAVKWESSDATKCAIDPLGIVYVSPSAEAGDEITITATSVYDDTKAATATITVA